MAYTAIPAAAAAGGGITTITSSGATVTITNPTGPTTNLEVAGTTYTFSTGLTNAAGTVTNDYGTGKSGGLTVFGDTLTTGNLTLRPNAADTTTGRVIVSGLGLQLPVGSTTNTAVDFGTTGTGLRGSSTSVQIVIAGADILDVRAAGGVSMLSNTAGNGFLMNGSGQVGMTYDGASGLRLVTGGSSLTRIAISSAGAITFSAASTIGVFGAAAVGQQVVGANVNNVAASGTTGQFDDFTNGTVYATDYAALHATVYQLTRSVAQHSVAFRNLGFGA